MKVAVAVKQVAQLDDEYELDESERVNPDSIERDLNEWDVFAVEAALQLAEASPPAEVVVVTVGDEVADDALLDCLARGADRGIRVEVDGVNELDPLATARVLSQAIAREQPDLVLCGVQSSDAVNGSTGTALAAYLNLPRVAVIRAVALDGETLTVERELEDGLVEALSLGLPALLTIQTGINEPRYPTLRAIKQARNKPRAVLRPADLTLDGEQIDRARGATLLGLEHPDESTRAEMLTGSAAEIAAQIAEIVKQQLGR